ncbi:MAG TPA: LysM peptidoglycan-binding domain-containing protein [Micromonosporaceae bacterium]|jgi:LysM repeat protein|nr:LysM peptidoglycan-binding domain-containing protein [Micromonosporaceae bacterium]
MSGRVRGGVARRGRVRLTRRGRLVVLGFFLALAALAVALAAPASQAADPARPAAVAVVRPGDTLWSVMERYAPGGDPFATIEEIRRLNGLPDYTVYAGQRLVLPRR